MWIEVVYTKECTTRVRLQRGRGEMQNVYVRIWKGEKVEKVNS